MNPYEEFERAMNRPGRRERLLAEIARRGLRIEHYPLHVRVVGPGVDMLAVKLEALTFQDLKSHIPARHS